METTSMRHVCLIASALILAMPLAGRANVPSQGIHKLDARLALIAAAAAEKRLEPLMSTALTREIYRRNSPLAVRWNAAGQVQVYLHFDKYGNPPADAELAALGATGIIVSQELGVVQAWIPATRLAGAAALSDVARVTVPRYAIVKRAPAVDALPRTGSVDTQGDTILGAQAFRQATGWTGQGITVGVISNGDDHIAASQGTGDLPSNIWNDPNDASFGSSGDEGTAMMEIIYDLAPGVKQLGFCGPQTTVEFVTCLNDFAANLNANIVVDDLGFPGVAMFTDGGFATAVKSFASSHPNVQLVTAAGNDAKGFWAGTWNPATVKITVNGVNYTQAQNFGTSPNPTQASFTVQTGDTAFWILEWDDNWVNTPPPGGTSNDPNDYDIVLFSASGTPLACNQGINVSNPGPPTTTGTYQPCNQTNSSPLDTPGPQPVQGDAWTNNGSAPANVYLQVFKVAGAPGINLKLLIESQKSNVISVDPNTPSGSIFGQAALAFPYELTVGAVPQNDTSKIELYSSQGPVNLPLIPANRMKPDIVGVDCVNVTGAGNFPTPFCGTSAAAPHIAGLLALLESAYPGSAPFQLMQDGAIQLLDQTNTYPNGTYGYGLPNMLSTLNKDPVPLATSFTAPSGITAGTAVTFTGGCLANGSSSGVSYNWNFGSSATPATSSVQNPSVTFNAAGTLNVSLTCGNSQGVTNNVTQAVAVSKASSGGGSSGGGGLGMLTLSVLMLLQIAAIRRR